MIKGDSADKIKKLSMFNSS